MSDIVYIDARVSGYAGDPIRLIGLCMTGSGRLRISESRPYQPNDEEMPIDPAKLVIVTDSPGHFDTWHLVYDEKVHMREVINTYQELTNAKRIKIEDRLNQYQPRQSLQPKQITETGIKYEFETELNNGQVAVLLMAWASKRMVRQSTLVLPQEQAKQEDHDKKQDDICLPFSIF